MKQNGILNKIIFFIVGRANWKDDVSFQRNSKRKGHGGY
jgi:hypothetical protein